MLKIPRIPEFDEDPVDIVGWSKNADFVVALEELCIEWEQRIAHIIKSVLPSKPKEFTPLAELKFWRDRYAALGNVYDQLMTKEARVAVQILRVANSDILPGFEYQHQELVRTLQEAIDISRFLSTIERHLKTLTFSKSFVEMKDAMPHIMEGLHLIWTLSRHYNKDERMLTLLEMIVRLLYKRTTEVLLPSVLFKQDPLEAQELTIATRELLQAWKDCYMATREKLEQSRKAARWEFDRSKLFPETDYVILISQHLSDMTQLLIEFQTFFGPEIKAVVGDVKKIEDALKKTQALVKPFMEIPVDPFLQANQKQWNDLLIQLRQDVVILETEAKNLIDTTVVTKSSDAAFDMLMKFKHIETREAIHSKLMKKFDETLMIYIHEVEVVRKFYEENKENPPINRYHPPISGRIWWVRALFYHIKKSIVNFRTQKDVVKTDVGQQACNVYLTLAREMKAFEDSWYKHFSDSAGNTVNVSLRTNVFMKQPAVNEIGPDPSRNADRMVIKVNVPPEVTEMIQEALHLEQMGYRINERVGNVALMRETLLTNSRLLSQILESYYAVRRKLQPREAEFMERYIRDLEKNFDQGLTNLKWTALGILDYAEHLTSVVQKFDAVVIQINAVAKHLRIRILNIKRIRLFKEPPYNRGAITLPVLDSWDYFRFWEGQREGAFDELSLLYRGLLAYFMKLESITYDTSTGKHRRFRSYYTYWENCIFKYLSKVVIRSLNDFEMKMRTDEALFDIDAELHDPDICISPSANEIFQLVAEGARDCVEGTKRIFRWRRASCIQVTPIKVGEGLEPFIYSFYADIRRLPRVLQLLLQIQENLQNILKNLWFYLKKYQEFKVLWIYDKEGTVEEFADSDPGVRDYCEKMAYYRDIMLRIMDVPQYRVEGCVRMNCRPLQIAISQQARDWILMLGKYLGSSTLELNKEFHKIVREFVFNINANPTTTKAMNKLVKTVQTLQTLMMDMEVRYRDLLERYAVMREYSIEFPEEEEAVVETTWQRWQILCYVELPKVKKAVGWSSRGARKRRELEAAKERELLKEK